VLLGPPLIYYLLSALDDDFKKLFKIAADFNDRVERTPETTLLYARFVAGVVRREKLLPFDRGAVARVIEQASRVVGDADRLSTGLRGIVDLMQEADQFTASAGREVVTAAEVQRGSMRNSAAVTGSTGVCKRKSAARRSVSRPMAKRLAKSTVFRSSRSAV
jgi:predicted ATP-dependent protease